MELNVSANRYIRKLIIPEFYEYVRYHKTLYSPKNHKPTNKQHQIIVASSYGDGSILYPHSKAKNPRITWNMGHEEHARFKLDGTKFLGSKMTIKPNGGFGETTYCVTTQCHPMLKPYIERVWINGSKVVDKELINSLDEVGWAWFYGDDGHLDKRSSTCFLHTEDWGENSNTIIINEINKFLNMGACVLHKYKGGTKSRVMYCIRFNKDGTKEFHKRIKKHMATGMEYKIIKSV